MSSNVLREKMKYLGQVTIFRRPVYSATVPEFAGLSDLELPSSRSVVLLISDASEIDHETIYAAASRLIERGAIYVCTWGSDCERVHDIFDEADVGDGCEESHEFIMTTWHSDDSLDEAVDFFVTCAFPSDHDLGACSWVAITVGDSALASSVEGTIGRAVATPETSGAQDESLGPAPDLPGS